MALQLLAVCHVVKLCVVSGVGVGNGLVRYTSTEVVVHNPETEQNFTIAGLILSLSVQQTLISTTSYIMFLVKCFRTHPVSSHLYRHYFLVLCICSSTMGVCVCVHWT